MADSNPDLQHDLSNIKRCVQAAQIVLDDNSIAAFISQLGMIAAAAVDLRNKASLEHYGKSRVDYRIERDFKSEVIL